MQSDIDRQEAQDAPDQSPQSCDQGVSTRKTDYTPSSPTEDDFIAARNVACDCLRAVQRLLFEPDDLAIRPADEKSSTITRAVKKLCEALDNTGVKVPLDGWRDDMDWDRSDPKRPAKIDKVKKWLGRVATVASWRGCGTSHKIALRLALTEWSDINNLIVRKSHDGKGSHEPGSSFQLEPELIEENIKDIVDLIVGKERPPRNVKNVKADVEIESENALDAWKAEARLESAERKPQAVEDQDDGLLLERVIDILTPKGGEIVKCLWDFKHATSYDRLATTPKLFRNDAPSDETIQKALKRVVNRLNEHPDLGVTIEISHSKRRVILIRPPDESGDK